MEIILREYLEVVPDPVSLIESMRAVGYTTESAVADIIDNSLSANASQIQVEYDATREPFVSILDNGSGMDAVELTNAMRHGSSNPNDVRDAGDLGRFGLGLKTASLSQCRKLTVASKKGGRIYARCWDLDFVQDHNKWLVIVPTESELEILPQYATLSKQESGTLVVWEVLDKLMSGSVSPSEEMKIRMSDMQEHLSFIFHRFTKKEDDIDAVDIIVNGVKLHAVDPFLAGNSFTQVLEGQQIRINNETINVQPYVLPHMSHLNPDEIRLAGGRDGLKHNQGFYIYRNRRLVIWGTWFRLVPKEEFYKLTRVKVDIPNTLDHLWSLDIKKSAAYPPDIIRNRLKDLIPHFANTSKTTITYPGRKQKNISFEPIWERAEPSHGSFRYDLNINNSTILKLTGDMNAKDQKNVQFLLKLISAALPLESIYADLCSDKRSNKDDEDQLILELVSIARQLKEIAGLSILDILNLDPLARYPQHHQQVIKEINV